MVILSPIIRIFGVEPVSEGEEAGAGKEEVDS